MEKVKATTAKRPRPEAASSQPAAAKKGRSSGSKGVAASSSGGTNVEGSVREDVMALFAA
eukprot:6431529-Lingulodinium_polyedra.AAC.1